MENQNIELTMGHVPLGTIVAFALGKEIIPKGWLACDGSKIPDEAEKLKLALNSTSTPNLNGRTLIGTASNYHIRTNGGEEKHTLTESEIPSHTHIFYGTGVLKQHGTNSIQAGIEGGGGFSPVGYHPPENSSHTGGNQPHNNMQPYYVVNYIIYSGID